MDNSPVICFCQQPCGFFPRRFLYAKIVTARRVHAEIGGRLLFFCHDADHDPRETQTILVNRATGKEQSLNFTYPNKTHKKYTPLYAKKVDPAWQQETARRLPQYIENEKHIELFKSIQADTVADFCLEMYRGLGLLDGVEIVRSSDPAFREAACAIDDFYVDVPYDNELVRARVSPDGLLRLHKGGNAYIDLPDQTWGPAQISPARDTRLLWMQSVMHATHYIAGASEIEYMDQRDAPTTQFIPRDEISDPHRAYVP